MAIDWQDVRYRGDARDVQELLETYRVGDYLEAFEAERRNQDQGIREKLLKHGIRLTERISPRIYGIFSDLCTALDISTEKEIFCLPDQKVNAFAAVDVREDGAHSLIGVTSGALEILDDAELRSILGHEIGHFLYGNNRLNALISTDPNNPSATVLPPLGESLFLRWRKKAEISADRVGLLGSRDFKASARGLLKATFGLSEKNLNLDIDALLAQIDEIKGHREMITESFASHPLLPIRLKALQLFSRSDRAKRNGFPVDGKAISDGDLEQGVDELVQLSRRYPGNRLHEAVMRVISLGGAQILSADRDITDDEVKILIHILQRWFTDEPEKEIVTKAEEIVAKLPEEAKIVQEQGSVQERRFILSRLADIALADGALMDPEGAAILKIGEQIGVPTKAAYSVIVGAAQAVGFRTDAKLNQIAGELRDSLQIGFSEG
ncbi:MAG: M48 family metalloprotease [Candidatus Eisenbacteria bacterium]|nr:M48 family metalloprotease [Candidatus Latescibacterota bacterium]MBD3302578.1 M48 family metalloprotease [Candidatus Eisenbacteria bacterium]